MSSSFLGIALSRKDGSAADGIHLLWTAPYAAGYSAAGFDIQRRRSNRERKIDCYTLTSIELETLHQNFRLATPPAIIGVRQAACPEFPSKAPDEPHKEGQRERPPEAKQTCIDFQKFRNEKESFGNNPLKIDELIFEVRSQTNTQILTESNFTGLNCGFGVDVKLPFAVNSVAVTLVSFAKLATITAFDDQGKDVGSAVMSVPRGQIETLRIDTKNIRRILIEAPANETLLLMFCYAQTPATEVLPAGRGGVIAAPEARRRLQDTPDPNGAPSVFPISITSSGHPINPPQFSATQINLPLRQACSRYDVNLREAHEFVSVEILVPGGLAIAMREGKAVDSKFSNDATGSQRFAFAGRTVDQVLIYVSQPARGLIVCTDRRPTPAEEEKDWSSVSYIAKNIQLPVKAVNKDLASDADEDNLASSRLLPGEVFDNSSFRSVAELMNDAAHEAKFVSPVWRTMLTREDLQDPFIELRPWHVALSLLTNAEWRRMLGFGYFDDGNDLTAGEVYDYRITGHFHYRDLKEEVLGFHSIPIGTTLPSTFHIGRIQFNNFVPAVVEIFPPASDNSLTGMGRKGIALDKRSLDGRSLTITFPTAVTRVVLELEPKAGALLTYEAKTSDYFFLGLSGSIFTNTVSVTPCVEIDFPEPISTLTLKGKGFLYSVRAPIETRSVDVKPDDLIDDWSTIYGVRYEATPAPAPPPFLGTTNLQQPMIPGDPALTTQSPPRSLGFHLQWLPPPSSGSTPTPWPADLAAFPPFDVLNFDIERRRVDTSGTFVEIDDQKLPTMFFGSRSARRDPPQLYYGIDLLECFPENPPPQTPVAIFMEAEDVLDSAKKRDEGSTPPPGSLHQYRIFSVDAIGRRSTVATLGSVVRLEKRLPPPQPVSPSPLALPATVPQPSGLRARILQSSDPELTAADLPLLGTHANAVVFEWGWRTEERTQDPYATEFRVYWQPHPPDLIKGTLTGTATLIGSLFEMSASMDQPVSADQMVGRYIQAGDYPFRITSHTAGQIITIRFNKSLRDATQVPAAANFEFHPVLKGNELRPSAWPERLAIKPITSASDYSLVIYDRLTLDAAHQSVRIWVGVSAADNQSYIADELGSAVTNGGRPGNESSIAAASASARYIGRPTFTVPLPLADVPEQVTDEPVAENIAVNINLPTLLPAVVIPAGHKVKFERMGFDVLTSLIGANSDNTIGVSFPDGTTNSYTLGNPADQLAFLAQIRAGIAGAVESKFLMDFALRFLPQLEPLWLHSQPDPLPFGPVTDVLPNKPERHMQRIRLVDPAGHISAGSAILPQVVRVPSLSPPVAAEFELSDSANDTVTIEARVHDSHEIKWLAIFSLVSDAATPPDPRILEKPQLLRLPNRRDLYPNDGLRLRLRNGTLLVPEAVAVSTGVLQPPDRLLSIPRTVGFEKRVTVWLVSLTRDGITSRFSGPRVATTGPAPLVAPTLTVSAGINVDQTSWTTPAVPAQVSVERSTDGGASWSRVTPWLPPNTTAYDIPRVASGPRRYRLVLRNNSNQTLNGAEVSLA